MLVQSGKAGCSFEVTFANVANESDFVVVDERDVSPKEHKRMPKCLEHPPVKPQMTLFDVAEKLREAERRRTLEQGKIKSRAAIQNIKAKIVQKEQKQAIADTYWALDAKLREADKRREELVSRIRERAHETVSRGEMVRNHINNRHSDLDESVTANLMRAAENRNCIIRDLKQRLHEHDAHIARVRKAHAVLEGKAAEGYWNLDQRLTNADRRRSNHNDCIREKASSPTSRIEAIKVSIKKEQQQKSSKIAERIEEAEVRRQDTHNQIRIRASEHLRKVDATKSMIAERANDMGAIMSEKLQKVSANRQRHLRSVRARQMEQRVKSERVRQAKRALAVEN